MRSFKFNIFCVILNFVYIFNSSYCQEIKESGKYLDTVPLHQNEKNIKPTTNIKLLQSSADSISLDSDTPHEQKTENLNGAESIINQSKIRRKRTFHKKFFGGGCDNCNGGGLGGGFLQIQLPTIQLQHYQPRGTCNTCNQQPSYQPPPRHYEQCDTCYQPPPRQPICDTCNQQYHPPPPPPPPPPQRQECDTCGGSHQGNYGNSQSYSHAQSSASASSSSYGG